MVSGTVLFFEFTPEIVPSDRNVRCFEVEGPLGSA